MFLKQICIPSINQKINLKNKTLKHKACKSQICCHEAKHAKLCFAASK
jgi:hypothetical protein